MVAVGAGMAAAVGAAAVGDGADPHLELASALVWRELDIMAAMDIRTVATAIPTVTPVTMVADTADVMSYIVAYGRLMDGASARCRFAAEHKQTGCMGLTDTAGSFRQWNTCSAFHISNWAFSSTWVASVRWTRRRRVIAASAASTTDRQTKHKRRSQQDRVQFRSRIPGSGERLSNRADAELNSLDHLVREFPNGLPS
jgi:hypothetical protein